MVKKTEKKKGTTKNKTAVQEYREIKKQYGEEYQGDYEFLKKKMNEHNLDKKEVIEEFVRLINDEGIAEAFPDIGERIHLVVLTIDSNATASKGTTRAFDVFVTCVDYPQLKGEKAKNPGLIGNIYACARLSEGEIAKTTEENEYQLSRIMCNEKRDQDNNGGLHLLEQVEEGHMYRITVGGQYRNGINFLFGDPGSTIEEIDIDPFFEDPKSIINHYMEKYDHEVIIDIPERFMDENKKNLPFVMERVLIHGIYNDKADNGWEYGSMNVTDGTQMNDNGFKIGLPHGQAVALDKTGKAMLLKRSSYVHIVAVLSERSEYDVQHDSYSADYLFISPVYAKWGEPKDSPSDEDSGYDEEKEDEEILTDDLEDGMDSVEDEDEDEEETEEDEEDEEDEL